MDHMKTTTVDARGLSCPEPVIMTKKVLDGAPERCTVIVDAVAARENVTRYARSQGYTVNVLEDEGEGEWTLMLSR